MPRRDRPSCPVAVGCALLVSLATPPSLAAGAGPSDAEATLDERVQLYALTAGYGAVTGYWIHELSGGESWSPWVLPGAGVTALSAATVAWIDQGPGFRLGQAQAIVTDTWIGGGIAGLWLWHDAAREPPDGRWSPALRGTLLWAGATLGAVIGVVRYELSPSPPGNAAFTGSVTLWSSALGGLLGGALTSDPDARETNASRAAALAAEGGLVLGSWLRRALEPEGGWSIGWVRAVDGGALLGAVAGGAAGALLSGDDLGEPIPLASAAGGLVVGGFLGGWLAPRWGLSPDAGYALVPEMTPERAGLALYGVF